ncbi:MAG: helix-hairpin-helix domain-containing protein [Bacteroidetes bacterium]|nr:helix-hairpin-helix domain-containing protein [Bacteroidota bacterium]
MNKISPYKKHFTKALVFIVICFLYHPSFAQTNPYEHIEKIIEKIIENNENEIDYSEIEDQLISIIESPLNLNTVEVEQLNELFFLSQQQIQSIIEYRKSYHGFKSIYELKALADLDKETLVLLIPFVYVGESKYAARKFKFSDLKYSRKELILKTETVLEDQLGYLDEAIQDSGKSYYQGNSFKYYTRYNQSNSSKYSLGITMEKDAGEEFFSGTQKQGFDFYSAHLFLKDIGPFSAMAIGDYSINFGQGLAFYTGFGFGKSPLVTDIYKSSKRLNPFKSVNENSFLRGFAIQSQLGKFELTAFYSNKRIDGTVLENDTLTNDDHILTSFYNSGYHRTDAELEKKNSNREQLLGSHLLVNFDKLKLGLSAITGKYSHEFEQKHIPYQYYDFSGSDFYKLSFDYAFAYKSLFLFGESAFDGNAFAHLTGALLSLGSEINAGILYRHYPPAYNTLYANAFRESGDVNNESGLYFALSFSPFSNCKIDLYVDQFNFPWIDYQRDVPTKGHEYLMDMHYSPSYRLKHNLRFKYQIKEKNLSGNEGQMNTVVDERKLTMRYDFTYNIMGPFAFRSRLEYSQFAMENTSRGILTFQDISYVALNYKLKLTLRYALFHTNNYDSRIYVYENDVPSTFSIYSFYGRGSRYYVLCKYQLNSKSSVWLKISQTKYVDRQQIGSGLNEITGDHKTDVRLLLKVKF